MPAILLHGLGQTPDSWTAAAQSLGTEVCCPALFAPLRQTEASYDNLYGAFAESCSRLDGPLRLCGLSLGGVLALQYAIEHPQRTESLVLIGTPFVMPKGLLKFQNLIFRWMPGRAFRQMGISKKDLICLTQSMTDLDFRPDLKKVSCPVLVLCGQRDRANRAAAMNLAAELPHGELSWVPGAGHEVNTQAPEATARILKEFWERTAASKERS